jgi:regulator of protease activity HflC (stomatin/prohibitin superfamily)
MEATSWLGDLVRTFAKVFPRLEHIPSNYRGVIFTRSKAKALDPGMHIYWPVWSEITQEPIMRQTLELNTQTLVSKDGQQIIVVATVVYLIDDIYKALVDTYDLEDTISDIAAGTVKEVIVSTDFEELHDDSEGVDEQLTDLIAESLEPYGIRVEKAFLIDFSTTFVLRCIQQ